ncbi:TolC family outer membrane protein [bacterium SCSIO 12827]|nr:TolC family outer membrane protein [bacterium SCSIO 12827]
MRRRAIAGTMTMGLVLASALCAPEAARAAPLEIELARLITNHPNILAAENTLESNRQGIDVAKARRLPTLSMTGDAGREFIDSPSTRSSGAKSIENKNVATFTLSQNLFDGYATRTAIHIAELNEHLARISLEGTRQNTLFQGVRAYITVLRQMRLLGITIESEGRIQRQLNLEDERVRRGSGIAVDVLQAKSRLQVAKERRVGFEGQLRDAMSRYQQVFGFPPNLEDMYDPRPPVNAVPSELDRALAIALVENPAVREAGTSIDITRQREVEAKSGLYPTIDLEGEFNMEQNNGGVLGTRRDYSIGFQADWELFSGFSTRSSTLRAAYDTAANRNKLQAAARTVEEQVRLAWQALETARERVILLENAVNIASEVAQSRRKLRAAGKETVINVLDAENEVNNAQINFTTASYDEKTAAYQLLLALGRLDPLSLNLVVQ